MFVLKEAQKERLRPALHFLNGEPDFIDQDKL